MTMQSDALPSKLNLSISGAIVAALAFQLFAMPVTLGAHPYVMAAIVVLLAAINTPFWSLIHEAVHRNFHANKEVNEGAGRFMSVLFGAGFGVLRFGHLMHHQYNRDWENEFFDESKLHPVPAWIYHYFKILGGLYLIEVVLSFLVACLPVSLTRKVARKIFEDDRHYQAVLNSLLKTENVWKMRLDCAGIVIVYGISAYLFGENWPVLALLIFGRALFISLMDNAYHYGTPEDNSVTALELKAPDFLEKFILNFNHHLTHHNNTRLPWTALKDRNQEQQQGYSEDFSRALFAQFKGPIRSNSSRIDHQ